MLTCIPGSMLMDNVHFQFNQVMHGFVLWAIAFILDGNLTFATVFMVLAVNFKQMALYFTLPFGVYALAIVQKRSKSIGSALQQIVTLLFVFVLTNFLIWLPFI